MDEFPESICSGTGLAPPGDRIRNSESSQYQFTKGDQSDEKK
jgi:hypothetical protein